MSQNNDENQIPESIPQSETQLVEETFKSIETNSADSIENWSSTSREPKDSLEKIDAEEFKSYVKNPEPFKIDPFKLELVEVIDEPEFERKKIVLDNNFFVYVTYEQLKLFISEVPEEAIPSSEIERARYLSNQIFKIRKERNMSIAACDQDIIDLKKKREEARQGVINAKDKFEVFKWRSINAMLTGESPINNSHRQLIRLTYMEEGKLKTDLLELENQIAINKERKKAEEARNA